ncbi:RNA-directed DNA polymerase from mobile element jockey [Trichonephila inaurata madagascariensis]|uniref:RNA-directed DNA polymerase from mobile element jockey n=1 Tax=Trichonephila inaurata madagascariensis TaxID=2747483 RepID=A0A8X6XQP4_9ARAC|nr:RNA-directed DNA polymerase from mobile element jockey [Trichonephila inaurata madagascariensis]
MLQSFWRESAAGSFNQKLDDLVKILNLGDEVILCGDLNTRHPSWGCVSANARGTKLLDFTNTNFVELVAPSTPTRFGYGSASILDTGLLKNILFNCQVYSLPELSSDPNSVRFYINIKTNFDMHPPQLFTNWNIFKNNINNLNLIDATTTSEIDSQIQLITNQIL